MWLKNKKNNVLINRDKCVFICKPADEDMAASVFKIEFRDRAGEDCIAWIFDNQEERDEAFEQISNL